MDHWLFNRHSLVFWLRIWIIQPSITLNFVVEYIWTISDIVHRRECTEFDDNNDHHWMDNKFVQEKLNWFYNDYTVIVVDLVV
jgi:hypothetical protein